jgi:hypothetical protein
MRSVLRSAVIAATILASGASYAGGPVILEEGNDELIVEKPARSAGILPIIGILVLACLVACGGGSDPEPEPEPDPDPKGQ